MSHLMDLAKVIVALKIAQKQNNPQQINPQQITQIEKKEEYVKEASDDRVEVTDEILDFFEYYHQLPWENVRVTNRGRGEVHIFVNHKNYESKATLQAGEFLDYDFLIETFALQCPIGQTTTVDLHMVVIAK